MTISASGVDTLRSVQGQNYGARTDSWAANSSQTDKGRFVVMLLNQFGRFPEDITIRLFSPSPYTKFIGGIVTEASTPVSRVVRCYRRNDGHLVGETRSDPGTGAYSFSGLKTGEEYFVLAFDDIVAAPDFNALVFDRLVAA